MRIKFITLSAFILLSFTNSSNRINAVAAVQTSAYLERAPYTSPFNYSRQEVEYYVKIIIAEICDINESELNSGTHLVDDLGMDSLDMYDLIIKCQDFFRIEFNIVDALGYDYTIKTFVDVVWHFCESDEDYHG